MIDATYEKWYLHNLIETQHTQNNRFTQKRQAEIDAKENEISSAKRFDVVDFSDEAIEAARLQSIEKSTEAAQTEPYNEPEDVIKTTYSPADFIAQSQKPQSLTEISIEKAQEEDEFHIGLLDLIDSGSIDAPQLDFDEIMKRKEEIKPVERNGQDEENTITVTDYPRDEEELGVNRPQAKAAEPLVESAEARRTDRSAPISNEKLEQIEKQSENSASFNTSDEIQLKRSEAKVTPAQQEGIQAYQRIQAYTNPYQMSINAASNVA